MRKNGVMTLEEFVKISIVILLLIAFIAFAVKMYLAIFGGSANEVDSFHALADQMNLMLQRNSTFDTNNIILALKTNKIEGFSTDSAKPDACPEKSKPCLCLSDDNEQNKKIACVSLDSGSDNVILVSTTSCPAGDPTKCFAGIGASPHYPSMVPQKPYRELYLSPGFLKNDTLFNRDKTGAIVFYVEKFKSDSFTHILVAPINHPDGLSNDDIRARQNALTPCPDDSSPQCVGKWKNERLGSDFCKYDGKNCTFIQRGNCELEKKQDKECYCGNFLMPVGQICHQAGTGGQTSLIPMDDNCDQVNSCADYCKMLDSDPACSPKEDVFCSINLCKAKINVECEIRKQKLSDGSEVEVCLTNEE